MEEAKLAKLAARRDVPAKRKREESAGATGRCATGRSTGQSARFAVTKVAPTAP